MGFYKIKGISEKMKHGRYRAAVPACILHSRAGWSWTEEVVEAGILTVLRLATGETRASVWIFFGHIRFG